MAPSAINRRNFIRKSTLSAGLVMGAPQVSQSLASGSKPDELRVAFIGCGRGHDILCDAMQNISGLQYVAACDLLDWRLKRTTGRIHSRHGYVINRYSDAAEMLSKEKDLDAVIVATPDFWHAPHTIMALESGAHVYCEKMMSNTLEGARSIVDAVQRTGKLCQIGYQRRSNPRYRYAFHELIQKHKLFGNWLSFNCMWTRPPHAGEDFALPPKKSLLPELDTIKKYGYQSHHEFLNWRQYRKFSTGLISNLMSHQLDVANWFLKGTAKNVHAIGQKHFFPDREQFSSIMAIVSYPSCSGCLECGFTGVSEHGYHEALKGENEILRMSERDLFTALIRHCDAPSWYSLAKRNYVIKRDGELQPPNPYHSDCSREYDPYFDLPGTNARPPHYYHLDNFFSAIRGETTLNHDAAQAFQSELALYAMDQSIHQTVPTHVPFSDS